MMKCMTSVKLAPGTNEVYDFICKKRAEGFDYKKACIAGLNKFLRKYYGSVVSLGI